MSPQHWPYIPPSPSSQMLAASALDDRTVVNCTWTDPELNSIENPLNTQLEGCGTFFLPISDINACRWFCILFEYVYIACFCLVASLLPFYLIDVFMQDSPENQLSKLRWPPNKVNIYLTVNYYPQEILGLLAATQSSVTRLSPAFRVRVWLHETNFRVVHKSLRMGTWILSESVWTVYVRRGTLSSQTQRHLVPMM